jgi:copper chaperone
MVESITYHVPGMTCDHCTAAVERELKAVPGVETIVASLESKLVTATGEHLDDTALRAAIDEAGYSAQ